jgi:hypothetical protein
MSEANNRRFIVRVLAAGTLILACSALALIGLFVAYPQSFVSAGTAAARSRFVGTWVGGHGVILQFRPDGTARSRWNAADQDVTYFEWDATERELIILQGSRQSSLRRSIYRLVTGRGAIDRYEVLATAPDQLEIRDARSGKRFQFTRTDDAILEGAP